MSRIHLKSHTVALWLSMAVCAAGAVSVACSSSSASDDSSAAGGAGKTGSAGKSGAGDSGGDDSTPSEGGAAGTVTDTPAGGDTSTPSGGSDAGAGGSTEPPPGEAGAGGAAGAPVVMEDPTVAAVARAKKLIAGLEMPCTMCHQANYAGANYWPNITPDEDTGIGLWSDEAIKRAITKGLGANDRVFCAEMQRFKFTDAQLSDVVTFLRSLKPVSKSITKVCTTK